MTGSEDQGAARPPTYSRRTRPSVIVSATAVVALLIGGLAGVLIGKRTGSDRPGPAATPSTVTVPGPPQPVQPAVPAATDVVCATWALTTNDYRTKEDEWAKTDPSIPAAQWSIQQRAITLNVIPVLRQEAADLRGFAAKASDPTLRFLMQLEAAYQEAFADRLPTYAPPGDQQLWQAAINVSVVINSQCYAVARPK